MERVVEKVKEEVEREERKERIDQEVLVVAHIEEVDLIVVDTRETVLADLGKARIGMIVEIEEIRGEEIVIENRRTVVKIVNEIVQNLALQARRIRIFSTPKIRLRILKNTI